MSVVSSTDVECFRRLTNPEVVDVNGAGTSTRQIAQQMRQAMEQVVAAQHSEELSKHKDDSSEDEASEKSKSKAPAGAASRLARAMHALQNTPERPPLPPPLLAEVRPPTAAQSSSSGLSAGTPSSLPVAPQIPQRFSAPAESRSEARPPSAATAPREEDKASSSEDEDDASTTCVKKDPETVRLEKQGYLIELQALRSKGVKLSREFSMKDTLTELEFEVQKQNSNLNATAAVSNMKDMMRIGFNGLEMANARFGPFLCMDGWAESLTSDMKRFDNALEKLYKRYWRKQSMSPVMELGMIILGSLAMHHFKSKLFGPVRPPPKVPAATAMPSQPESVSPPPPRLRRGTPAQTPMANQRDPSRTALRPTLKPPTAMFGF